MANTVRCVTLTGEFCQMLGSDATAMGRFSDVVRCDLGVTDRTGFPK